MLGRGAGNRATWASAIRRDANLFGQCRGRRRVRSLLAQRRRWTAGAVAGHPNGGGDRVHHGRVDPAGQQACAHGHDLGGGATPQRDDVEPGAQEVVRLLLGAAQHRRRQ